MAVTRTLYAKLAVLSLSLLFALGIVYVALTLYTSERHFEEVQQKLNQDLADHLVAEKILIVDGNINEAVLKAAQLVSLAAQSAGYSADQEPMFALLHGVSGERYLRFRHLVTRCLHDEHASHVDALFALHFACHFAF